jgi:CHRD domain
MYRAIVLGTLIAAAAVAGPAVGGDHFGHVAHFRAVLSGFNEVPAINSEGSGTVDVWLDRQNMTLSYKVTFSGLSSNTTQSHIHLGKIHTSGSVVVFFCTNLTPPAGVAVPPPCPVNGGTVSGMVSAADVLGVAAQNVKAGDFDAIEDALTSDTAYANVHSVNFPAGEIRGQLVRDF